MAGRLRETTVAEICEVFDGPHATPAKTGAGPVFLGITSLNKGRIDLSGVEHLSEGDFAKWTRRVTPRAGDVVFSYETKLGEAAIIPDGLRCCLGRRMALMRPDPHKVDSRFLLYYYLGPEFQDVIRGRTIHGSTVERIALIEFPKFPLRLPPLAEQKAIAAVLGALDDKIELNRRMNATLEAMARALFQSCFVDFEPVRAKLDGRQPTYLDQVTAALFPTGFHETKLGRIPLGWQIGNLGNLCKLKRGHDLPTSLRTVGGVPVISSSGFSGRHGEAKAIGPGVVTGRYGTIGKVFFVETDYWPLNTTLYVEDFKGNPPRYIFHILGQVDYSNYTDKAAVPGVNRNHLHEEPMVLPPMAIRQAFADFVAPWWALHLSNECQSRTLADLRDTLLPKLLSGELNVVEVEKRVAV